MERYIERVKKSIADKEPPLKVAETRLKKRTQAGSGNFPPTKNAPVHEKLFTVTANPLKYSPLSECLVLTRCPPLPPPYFGKLLMSSTIKQQAGLVLLFCLSILGKI